MKAQLKQSAPWQIKQRPAAVREGLCALTAEEWKHTKQTENSGAMPYSSDHGHLHRSRKREKQTSEIFCRLFVLTVSLQIQTDGD